MTTTRPTRWYVVLAAVTLAAASLDAQNREEFKFATGGVQIGNVESGEEVPPITGAPFTADATTEFTQTLSDGNRIEQRFSTSIARDNQGRTRRDQQMAFVGPLAVLQQSGKVYTSFVLAGGGGRGVWTDSSARTSPRKLVVITDPIERVAYTLDDERKEARKSPALIVQRFEGTETRVIAKPAEEARTAAGQGLEVEQLGTRQIEGVAATGIRTTNTIAAGEIGNLAPIKLVTERWFSKELGMAVLITRSDPRSGDTVYRLTNIVRAEPPPDLFTVPSDYKVIDFEYAKRLDEIKKLQDAGHPAPGGRGLK